ncbi:DUF427 domain-containing protein [Silvimonas iriomotensis]|uniref:DUF427 domain-containing protein n=1 Tax=Silvimonas iriomotensis TaxID=449662 RepID=A0ABQ2P823_9NEIS|nr:DUF427 domain-containing protein [Silvimonas iriomotensis]GGP20173.1 hypothetical protein GCM10010970_13910 [Silvimonas iriomotensis]
MPERTVRIPGPDHPITLTREGQHVLIKALGHTLVDTRNAITLREASYPPVYYIPREDVDMGLLARSSHETWCPYKGECHYYNIAADAERGLNAVWTYETPHDAVADIKGYLAFYPDRVNIQVS